MVTRRILGGSVIEVVGAAVLGLALLTWWALASRRHVDRRTRADADWGDDAASGKPDLWTSGARCPHCLERGGLLELHGDDLWFVCLSCNQRHQRSARG